MKENEMELNQDMIEKIDDVLDKKKNCKILRTLVNSNLPEEREAAYRVMERRLTVTNLKMNALQVENSILRGDLETDTLIVEHPSIHTDSFDERMQHVHIHFMGDKKETSILKEKCVLIIKWSAK
jgi:hypothetical protein